MKLTKLKTYEHVFALAFTVRGSTSPTGDVPGDILRQAIVDRLQDLNNDELEEACGAPEEVCEEEPDVTDTERELFEMRQRIIRLEQRLEQHMARSTPLTVPAPPQEDDLNPTPAVWQKRHHRIRVGIKLNGVKDTYRCLALCTSHLPKGAMEFLVKCARSDDNNMAMERNTGVFVKLYEVMEANDDPAPWATGWPTLHNLLWGAYLAGYRLVEFDSDAEEVDDLDTFDWQATW